MPTPSIDEVAAAAGVHRSTVSRAFSRPEAVKRETREHVRRVAASMGYTMSPLAQALRTKVSTLVPLIVPDITNPYFAELPRISDLETTMAVIWNAYAHGRQGRTGVHTQHR